jgi:hypothetical protein
MRPTFAQIAVVSTTLTVAFGFGSSPALAQTRVASLDELRRELAPGDFITIVGDAGPPLEGRLIRFGDVDLDVRLRGTARRRPADLTVPLDTIQSLQRPPDSTRNGTLIGAGIGAGTGGAMFLTAMAIDANEMDEWAPLYIGFAAVSTGVGALIGWLIDDATSKPHIRFDAASKANVKVRVQPVVLRRGIAVAVSFAP